MNNTEYPIAVEIKNSEDLNIDLQQYWFALKRRFLPAMAITGGFFAHSILRTLSQSRGKQFGSSN
ncbi:MAG: hypothetical protein KI793_15335 [Rivularia sp. (in: Bacteria)]|nr:hypothetical protein [Rivularia sp. MS3]